ncbi:MAG: hypothetical protein Q8Q26_18585, partial [Pseudorhodobacter sp.]|nr:hypothetical protein [Pseudorhodobacter sp.]
MAGHIISRQYARLLNNFGLIPAKNMSETGIDGFTGWRGNLGQRPFVFFRKFTQVLSSGPESPVLKYTKMGFYFIVIFGKYSLDDLDLGVTIGIIIGIPYKVKQDYFIQGAKRGG